MNAIEIKNLKKAYEYFVLDDVSFTLPKGSIMGLVGENGAGKTTTIKLIMGAAKRDSGQVRVLGVENKDKEFLHTKEDIGIVLDQCPFSEDLTFIRVGKIMSGIYENWDKEVFKDYGEKFNLNPDKKIKEYSRGMTMKLSLAVALSHNAKLLILDEPTSGLDPMAREELLEIFNEFTRNEENSILISSHIVSDLEKICDYIKFIHKGKLVITEEKDLLLDKYALLKLKKEEIEEIPENAIVSKKEGVYGYEVLVAKELVGDFVKAEHITLEDIILFLAKDEKNEKAI